MRILAAVALLSGIGHAESMEVALREPAYASGHPRYAQVLFGSTGERRVWLVADGRELFVDRNGNGDLTETGERVAPNDAGDHVTEIHACGADGKRGNFTLRVTLGVDAEGATGLKVLSVSPVEDIQQFHSTAAFIPLGDSPRNAPTIPIDGPLRFVLMDHWTGSTACRLLPRDGGEHEFSLLVATPVLGIKGEAYVYPNLYALQGEELPTVRVEFEPRDGSGAVAPPLRLWQCECARRYRFKVAVPPAPKTLRARVAVSFPGWRHGELPPATFELAYTQVTGDPGSAAPPKDRPAAQR